MKRLMGLLLCLAWGIAAFAQGPPFRFWQAEESVDAVKANLSVITYEVGWDIPRPTNPDYPQAWSQIGVRYRWQRKNGALTIEYFQALRGQSWFGKSAYREKINRNFSASDDLKHTMPPDAVRCYYAIEIESGLETPGFTDRRFWRSASLVQRR